MNHRITAAQAEKIYREQPFAITLIDEFTGRISVFCRQTCGRVSGKWQLEIDGVRYSFGQFLLNEMNAGEYREFLLSVDVPDICWGSEAVLIIRLYDAENELIASDSFPMPPSSHYLPAPIAEQFFCGVRFDVSQAFISSGKLSAVIDSNGMRELRYNGDKLISGSMRPALWRSGMVPESLRDLKLDRIRISADRFVSDGKSVECHALALPAKMEVDELEFTQRFTPQEDGTIRYDAEFVVPESFSGVPRLGVAMRLPGTMRKISFYGNGPQENYPGSKAAVRSNYCLDVSEMYPAFESACAGGTRSEVRQLTASDPCSGRKLQITGGAPFAFSALLFDEYAIDDAANAGKMPCESNEICLHIDCRIGENAPVKAGVYKMTLFFK